MATDASFNLEALADAYYDAAHGGKLPPELRAWVREQPASILDPLYLLGERQGEERRNTASALEATTAALKVAHEKSARHLSLVPAVSPSTALFDKFRDLADELALGVPKPEWIRPGRLARGALTYTGGYIGAGKTPTALAEIRALFAGEPWLGFPDGSEPDRVAAAYVADGFRVVYLTQEAAPTFLPAVAQAGLTPQLIGKDRFRVGYFHDFALDSWAETVKAATAWLDGNGLLVVDTTLDWSQASDENDAATMTAALQPLTIACGTGIAVHAIGHTVKSIESTRDEDVEVGVIRGSGAVVSNASLVFIYKKARPKMDGDARLLKLVRTRLDYGDMDRQRYVVLEDGRLRVLEKLDADIRATTAAEARVETYLREQPGDGWVRRSDVRAKLSMSGSGLDLAVGWLGDAVECRGDGNRHHPVEYRLVRS